MVVVERLGMTWMRWMFFDPSWLGIKGWLLVMSAKGPRGVGIVIFAFGEDI